MIDFKKHTGIFNSKKEFEASIPYLSTPWVAYVLVDGTSDKYEIYYSTNPGLSSGRTDTLEDRVRNIEGEKVFLSSSEYEALVASENAGTDIKVMNPDGTIGPEKVHIFFNNMVYYYTYEE